jgi:multidrug transporter EmrE-like cation transporter
MASGKEIQTSRVKRRVTSGVVGLIMLAVGIWLENALPEHPVAVQVGFWTMMVFVMTALINYKQYREKWFWSAMLAVVLAHAIVVSNFRARLPFYDLGVVILISGVEAVLLQAVVIAVSRIFQA